MGRDEALREVTAGLRDALAADPPRSHWVQLATVDGTGAARVRTVLLHDVSDDGVLTFATDAASGKVAHLRARPRAEVCVLSRERLSQWRLLARFVEGDAAARRTIWRQLPPHERGYYDSPPPGIERAQFPESAFHEEARSDEPAERFVVLLGTVERVDRLDVATTPHRRFFFERGAPWTKLEVTP